MENQGKGWEGRASLGELSLTRRKHKYVLPSFILLQLIDELVCLDLEGVVLLLSGQVVTMEGIWRRVEGVGCPLLFQCQALREGLGAIPRSMLKA